MDGGFKWTEIICNLSLFPTRDLLNLRLAEGSAFIVCKCGRGVNILTPAD